jgi:hypothetical protein
MRRQCVLQLFYYNIKPYRPISYWARKVNIVERGNSYYACDLEASVICEAVKHWRCYLEGCSKFLVVSDHDTLNHILKQANDRLNKYSLADFTRSR